MRCCGHAAQASPLSKQNGTKMKRAASTRRKLSSSTDSLSDSGRGFECATNLGAVLLPLEVTAPIDWCMPVARIIHVLRDLSWRLRSPLRMHPQNPREISFLLEESVKVGIRGNLKTCEAGSLHQGCSVDHQVCK